MARGLGRRARSRVAGPAAARPHSLHVLQLEPVHLDRHHERLDHRGGEGVVLDAAGTGGGREAAVRIELASGHPSQKVRTGGKAAVIRGELARTILHVEGMCAQAGGGGGGDWTGRGAAAGDGAGRLGAGPNRPATDGAVTRGFRGADPRRCTQGRVGGTTVVGSRREPRRPGRPHSRQPLHVLVPVEVRHQVLEALGVGHLVGKTAIRCSLLGIRAAPPTPMSICLG